MRTLRSISMTAAALAAMIILSARLAAQGAPQKVDMTGKWSLSVVTDNGTGTPTVTFKQQGDSLTGHYSSQLLGEHDFKGAVKEREVTWSFVADIQGATITVSYTATVESDGTLKGTVDFGGAASGTFTGKRSQAP